MGMGRLIVLAAADLFPVTMTEVQFVVLLRLTVDQGELCHTTFAPYPELIARMRSWFSSENRAQVVESAFQESKIEIEHRYALPVDTLTPLAVVYKPMMKHALLTNKNHLSNPAQFLMPQLCRSTSGFLNFLGTFTLAASMQGPGPHLIKIDNIDKAMDQDIDPWFRWLYHFIDSGRAFDPNRIYVNSKHPEEYQYAYGG